MVLFPLRGVVPPGLGGGAFHKADGGDEGVEDARVLSRLGLAAECAIKFPGIFADELARLVNAEQSQVSGECQADVGDRF